MSISDKRIFYPLRPRKRRSRPPILGGQLIETEEHKNSFFEGQNGSGFLGKQKNRFLRTKYMSLCSYVKKKYVIMFLCLKLESITFWYSALPVE